MRNAWIVNSEDIARLKKGEPWIVARDGMDALEIHYETTRAPATATTRLGPQASPSANGARPLATQKKCPHCGTLVSNIHSHVKHQHPEKGTMPAGQGHKCRFCTARFFAQGLYMHESRTHPTQFKAAATKKIKEA